jgi:hypothetical protein
MTDLGNVSVDIGDIAATGERIVEDNDVTPTEMTTLKAIFAVLHNRREDLDEIDGNIKRSLHQALHGLKLAQMSEPMPRGQVGREARCRGERKRKAQRVEIAGPGREVCALDSSHRENSRR